LPYYLQHSPSAKETKTMKSWAFLILITSIFMNASRVQAAESDGRYQIVAPIKNRIMLIDSATGRTWSMTKGNRWKQIEFFREGRTPRSQIAPEKMSPAQAKGSWEGGFKSQPLAPSKSSPIEPLKQKKSK
jgi:hypothetical protein